MIYKQIGGNKLKLLSCTRILQTPLVGKVLISFLFLAYSFHVFPLCINKQGAACACMGIECEFECTHIRTDVSVTV